MIVRARGLWQWAQHTRPFRTFSRFTEIGGGVLTSGMSYQAMFAIFAGLYISFASFGFVLRSREELLDQIVDQLNIFMPGLLGDEPGEGVLTVQDLLSIPGLTWTSIVAAFSLLWVALNWFTGTRRSIRLIFGLEVTQYRNALLLKVRDLALAIGFFVVIVMSAALTVISSNLTDLVLSWWGADEDSWFFGGLGALLRYGAMFVFDVLMLVAIHRFLAEVKPGRWNLLTGCMLGAAALFGLKLLGTALLGGVSSNPLYATFAVFIGLLLWLNLICRALLLTSSWIATGADPSLGAPEDVGAEHSNTAE